jgi:plastocyanin
MRKALAGAVVLLSLVLSSLILLAAPASAAEQTVTVRDNVFDPISKSVNINDTIRWTNQGSNTHNVTFDPPLAANLGDMGPASSSPNNQSVSPAFTTAGTFTYYCRFHQSSGMRGTVVVGGAGTTPTGTPTITSNATSIPLGGSITVTGSGWPAGSQVDIALTPGAYMLATATATNGSFSQLVVIPATGQPGTYQITATVKGSPGVVAPPLPLTVTSAAGTTVTTSGTVSTVTTLATGSLPSSLPPSASSGTNFGGRAAGTARTGRNEHVMMVAAAVALALGTLLVMVTPKPGRHAKRAFSNLF